MLGVIGCAPPPNEKDFAPKKFSAQAAVDGYDIGVELITSHPTLAEHKKLLKIQNGGKVIFKGEFHDSGGFSRFFVLRKEEKIFVVDGLGNGVAINTKNKSVSTEVSSRDVDPDWNDPNVGVFQFVDKPSYAYSWVPRSASDKRPSNSAAH
jgi:hypothetical protein